jgi:hypothetical protein
MVYNLFKALNPEASHVLVAREADHAFHGTVGHPPGLTIRRRRQIELVPEFAKAVPQLLVTWRELLPCTTTWADVGQFRAYRPPADVFAPDRGHYVR